MTRIIALFLLSSIVIIISGCHEAPVSEATATAGAVAAPSTELGSEQGAWLGEGIFSSENGNQQIKAQLELLADGTYRFLVIEPRVLMMVVGLETGNWKRTGQELSLTPFKDQTGGGSGKLGALNRAPKNFSAKSLTVDGEAFLLQDKKMNMRFQPNLKATQKLHDSGAAG